MLDSKRAELRGLLPRFTAPPQLAARIRGALVFRRRQHTINLLVWPQWERPAAPRQARKDGYNARAWSQGGLNFTAVSEIPAEELDWFIEAYRDRTR